MFVCFVLEMIVAASLGFKSLGEMIERVWESRWLQQNCGNILKKSTSIACALTILQPKRFGTTYGQLSVWCHLGYTQLLIQPMSDKAYTLEWFQSITINDGQIAFSVSDVFYCLVLWHIYNTHKRITSCLQILMKKWHHTQHMRHLSLRLCLLLTAF